VRGGDMVKGTSCLQPLVLRPDSKPRLAWDLISVAVLLLDIILIPLMLLPPQEGEPLAGMGLFITSFWTTDILISFMSGYHDLGFVEMRPGKIARKYVRGWFVMDVLIVGVDWGSMIAKTAASDVVGLARFGKLARVSRLMRLLRLLRAVKVGKIISALSEYVHSATLMTVVGVLRTVLGILVVCHYIACAWYHAGTMFNEPDTWMDKLHREDIGYVYVTAMHWAITQFTPGGMEINPRNTYERIFSICVIIVGLVAFSSFVSSITAAMSQLHKAREVRMKQTGDIRRFITENRLSLHLGSSIMAFLKAYNFEESIRLHECDLPVFMVLPETMKVRLRYEIYQPILAYHPLFVKMTKLSDRGMVNLCHAAMTERSLVLSQELFTAEAEAHATFFVVSGVLEYFNAWEDRPCKEIRHEEWICEAVLWVKWDHRGRLAALTPSEIMVLNAGHFRRIVGRYPELHNISCRYAVEYVQMIQNSAEDEPIDTWADKKIVAKLLSQAEDAGGDARTPAWGGGALEAWNT